LLILVLGHAIFHHTIRLKLIQEVVTALENMRILSQVRKRVRILLRKILDSALLSCQLLFGIGVLLVWSLRRFRRSLLTLPLRIIGFLSLAGLLLLLIIFCASPGILSC